MNQPKLLELAKQGDVKAIASVLNYLLQDKGMTAKAHLKDGCLQIMLESAQVPKRESSVALIHQAIIKLEVQSLKSVKVYGKQTGQDFPVWTELITLTDKVEELQKQKNQNADTTRWPVWLPYPSSWLRTFALVIWIGIVLRIAGFWGIVIGGLLSLIAEHPGPLLWFLGLALLASGLIFSYIHHFLFSPSDDSNSVRWFPNSRSLWEGFYAPVVMVLSFLVVVIILLPFYPFPNCDYQNPEQFEYCMKMAEQAAELYIKKYHLEKIATAIWLLSVAYLYQIDCLLRRYFTFKSKNKFNSAPNNQPINNIDIEVNRLRGQMGFIQVKKISPHPLNTTTKTKKSQRKTKKIPQIILILFLIFLGAAGSYGLTKLPELQQAISLPIASPTSSPMPSTPIAIAPSQSTSEIPLKTPQSDPFQQAVNNAMSAAKLTQTAKSKDDWNTIASQWQEAIALMKAVPTSHLHYAVAQKKAIEYQRNLEYARLAASRL